MNMKVILMNIINKKVLDNLKILCYKSVIKKFITFFIWKGI